MERHFYTLHSVSSVSVKIDILVTWYIASELASSCWPDLSCENLVPLWPSSALHPLWCLTPDLCSLLSALTYRSRSNTTQNMHTLCPGSGCRKIFLKWSQWKNIWYTYPVFHFLLHHHICELLWQLLSRESWRIVPSWTKPTFNILFEYLTCKDVLYLTSGTVSCCTPACRYWWGRRWSPWWRASPGCLSWWRPRPRPRTNSSGSQWRKNNSSTVRKLDWVFSSF